MFVLQLGAGDAPYFARELQLIAFDELKEKKLIEQEAAKLDREAARIYRETGTTPDLLGDHNNVLRLRKKIHDYSEGGLAPSIIQNLPVGKAIVKIPTYNYGVPVTIPYFQEPSYTRDTDPRPQLIARSKQNFGTASIQAQETTSPEPARAAPTEQRIPPRTPHPKPSADKDEAEVFKIKFE